MLQILQIIISTNTNCSLMISWKQKLLIVQKLYQERSKEDKRLLLVITHDSFIVHIMITIICNQSIHFNGNYAGFIYI